MADRNVCFSEQEVATVLWALVGAREIADDLDALSTRAFLEGVYRMVRTRFDERDQE